MVSLRRHRIEMKSWKVSGRSLSRGVRRRTQDTASRPPPTEPSAHRLARWDRGRRPSGAPRSSPHLAGEGNVHIVAHPMDDVGHGASPIVPGRDHCRHHISGPGSEPRSAFGRRSLGQRRRHRGHEPVDSAVRTGGPSRRNPATGVATVGRPTATHS